MVHDTDPRRIHLGPLREHRVAIRVNICQVTKRLALRSALRRVIRIVARRTNRERDKTAPRQLQAKVAPRSSLSRRQYFLRLPRQWARFRVSHTDFGRVKYHDTAGRRAAVRPGGMSRKPICRTPGATSTSMRCCTPPLPRSCGSEMIVFGFANNSGTAPFARANRLEFRVDELPIRGVPYPPPTRKG